ncbi:hypothetical protein ACJX0J_025823, partial [Zea mays]
KREVDGYIMHVGLGQFTNFADGVGLLVVEVLSRQEQQQPKKKTHPARILIDCALVVAYGHSETAR